MGRQAGRWSLLPPGCPPRQTAPRGVTVEVQGPSATEHEQQETPMEGVSRDDGLQNGPSAQTNNRPRPAHEYAAATDASGPAEETSCGAPGAYRPNSRRIVLYVL